MTTEEALAVAESVQLDESAAGKGKPPHVNRKGLRPGRGTKHLGKSRGGGFSNENVQHMRRHWEDPENIAEYDEGSAKHQERSQHSKGMTHSRPIHIQHVNSVHFSETAQFAEATKARFDAAERSAMRRAIVRANIHPAIKKALLRHSGSVQFSDSGDEVSSVPMTWVLAAARGLLGG